MLQWISSEKTVMTTYRIIWFTLERWKKVTEVNTWIEEETDLPWIDPQDKHNSHVVFLSCFRFSSFFFFSYDYCLAPFHYVRQWLRQCIVQKLLALWANDKIIRYITGTLNDCCSAARPAFKNITADSDAVFLWLWNAGLLSEIKPRYGITTALRSSFQINKGGVEKGFLLRCLCAIPVWKGLLSEVMIGISAYCRHTVTCTVHLQLLTTCSLPFPPAPSNTVLSALKKVFLVS